MDLDKFPQRIHSLPKILLCVSLFAFSSGAAAQAPQMCTQQDQCSPISAAKSYLDQTKQNLACATETTFYPCRGWLGGVVSNEALCGVIVNLDTSAEECLAEWDAWFLTEVQSIYSPRPPAPSCGSAFLGQIALFKSDYGPLLGCNFKH